MRKPTINEIRRVLADYMWSEGCSCCRNAEAHEWAAKKLAQLLKVPKYKDGSGFDFYRFRSKLGPRNHGPSDAMPRLGESKSGLSKRGD